MRVPQVTAVWRMAGANTVCAAGPAPPPPQPPSSHLATDNLLTEAALGMPAGVAVSQQGIQQASLLRA